jgi:hypothetical protein
VGGKARLHLEDVDAVGDQRLRKVAIFLEIRIGDRHAERHFAAVIAAEQLSHRQAEMLADDIKKRHFDGGLAFSVAHDGFLDLTHERRHFQRIGPHDERAHV